MHIQRISAATPISTVAQNKGVKETPKENKNLTNPIEADSSSRTSQILRNYFFGSQMVNPAFTGFPCSTANFKVKQLEDMPCTCCGRPMMTGDQVKKFALTAGRASGEQLNKILDDHMDYFRADEKAVVHFVQKQLKTKPDATLTGAIRGVEYSPAKILRDEQMDVLKRTSEKSQELLGKENSVQNFCNKVMEESFVSNKTKGNHFDRTDFLADLTKLEKQNKIDHEDMHQILNVAVQLPESERVISRIMSKYSASSNVDFAKRLIEQSIVTAEHIHPKSLGGPNNTGNYMGECKICNSSRGNMSYDTWMQKYPNMPDNIQSNADAVTEEIIKGKIGGNYDDYPVDLKNAVAKETQGRVVLKVKNPAEIDQAREDRKLAKPKKDEKEKADAAKEHPMASAKKGGKKHNIVRIPSEAVNTAEVKETLKQAA